MLKVVQGRLSEYYDHFGDYEFHGCEATDTRLMGVVALRVTWVGKDDRRARYYQVMHLDFSEYGVDDYFEFEVIAGSADYREKMEDMRYHWHSFLKVMGGTVIDVTHEEMLSLIESARTLASDGIVRSYDDDENREFRRDTLIRWDMMKEALYRDFTDINLISGDRLIAAFSPKDLSTCETINYFVMRLVDHDFEAAEYLSEMSRKEMEECMLTHPGLQMLVRNRISPSKDEDDIAEGLGHPYRCRMTTLADAGYYYSSFVLWLDRDYRHKNAKVTGLKVGSMNRLSDYEAAIQMQITEYITVFDCRDRILKDFDGNRIEFLCDVEPKRVNNGWLYTIYNADNSHVNQADYWLNADVYGYALLTIDGEFILMSNKLRNINYMDECTAISMYAPFMDLDGRYQLETPIFHDLCDLTGVMFRQLIEHPDDY